MIFVNRYAIEDNSNNFVTPTACSHNNFTIEMRERNDA